MSHMRFSEFAASTGRKLIAEKLEFFQQIINDLENIYSKRPFDQQNAASLLQLWLLVNYVRPRSIFELGTGSRASTIALALGALRPGIFVHSPLRIFPVWYLAPSLTPRSKRPLFSFPMIGRARS